MVDFGHVLTWRSLILWTMLGFTDVYKKPHKAPNTKVKKNQTERCRKDVTYLYSSSRCNAHSLRHFSLSSIIFLRYKLKCYLPRMISISYSNIQEKKKHHQSSEHNLIFLKIAIWVLNLLLLILNVRVERRICLYISGSELQPMDNIRYFHSV